jgi:hypothetical protein
MGQFPGHKTGALRAEGAEFKLIRGQTHSDRFGRQGACAVHD